MLEQVPVSLKAARTVAMKTSDLTALRCLELGDTRNTSVPGAELTIEESFLKGASTSKEFAQSRENNKIITKSL